MNVCLTHRVARLCGLLKEDIEQACQTQPVAVHKMKLNTSSDNRSAYKDAVTEMNGYAAGLGIKYGPTTAASASTEKPGSS